MDEFMCNGMTRSCLCHYFDDSIMSKDGMVLKSKRYIWPSKYIYTCDMIDSCHRKLWLELKHALVVLINHTITI
jgi:hypothetical protein